MLCARGARGAPSAGQTSVQARERQLQVLCADLLGLPRPEHHRRIQLRLQRGVDPTSRRPPAADTATTRAHLRALVGEVLLVVARRPPQRHPVPGAVPAAARRTRARAASRRGSERSGCRGCTCARPTAGSATRAAAPPPPTPCTPLGLVGVADERLRRDVDPLAELGAVGGGQPLEPLHVVGALELPAALSFCTPIFAFGATCVPAAISRMRAQCSLWTSISHARYAGVQLSSSAVCRWESVSAGLLGCPRTGRRRGAAPRVEAEHLPQLLGARRARRCSAVSITFPDGGYANGFGCSYDAHPICRKS